MLTHSRSELSGDHRLPRRHRSPTRQRGHQANRIASGIRGRSGRSRPPRARAVVTIFPIVVGALCLWAYSFANSNVHNQLVQQRITFPVRGNPHLLNPQIGPWREQCAGLQLLTGPRPKRGLTT